MMNNNIKCMNDIYEMDIKEVERQYYPLVDAYYDRLDRVLLQEAEGDWDKVSERDMMIIEKMEAVLSAMQERLIEAGLYDINDYLIDDDNKEDDNMIEDKLANRFFEILEEGGEYVELFAIRDLMINEYINGRRYQVDVLQIDDIIEEQVFNVRDGYIDSEEAKIIANKAYEAIDKNDLDKAFELVNLYGSEEINGNVYVYYCLVKQLERVTGENYIEICI